MERAIVHSDLTKNEIQPQLLMEKYIELLKLDIKHFFPEKSLQKVFCPVTGEKAVRGGSSRNSGLSTPSSEALEDGELRLALERARAL